MSPTVLLSSTKVKDMPFQIIDGDRGPNYPKGYEFSDSGFCLFLSAKNVTKDGLDFSQKQFITEAKDRLLRKGKLQRGDIILTTRGTVGNVALYDDSVEFNDVRINSGMIIIRCNKKEILPEYLYYILKSKIFQDQVENFRSGSAQPQLPIRDMQNMRLPLVALSEQKFIVDQIMTMDEKIELNRRMNETLEQMGQALFKHYFIDNPERNSWVSGKVTDLGTVITGKTPSKANAEYFGAEVLFLKVPDMHTQTVVISTEDGLSEDGSQSQLGKFVPKWSTCVSCIATVGVVSLAGEELQTNQQINSIVPTKSFFRYYNYFLMKQKSGLIKSMASSGSATPNLNKSQFENIRVVLPPNDVLSSYDCVVASLFDLIESNSRHTANLAQLRDTLLPRLMLGKFEI